MQLLQMYTSFTNNNLIHQYPDISYLGLRKSAVERILKDKVPGVTEVIAS